MVGFLSDSVADEGHLCTALDSSTVMLWPDFSEFPGGGCG